MTVYLKDLYFGCADGDTESNKKDFLDLFYKGNNKYDEIVDESLKFIIHGQKGTGKTILGRYIEKTFNIKGIKCKILNKDDIILTKMIEKNKELVDNEEIVPLFKWIVYYKMYQILDKEKSCHIVKFNIKALKNIITYKKSLKELRDIFNKRYPCGNYEFQDYDTLVESIDDIEAELAVGIVSKAGGKSEKKYSENKKYIKKEFYKVLEQVEECIINCLKVVNITLILDDLDEMDINFKAEDGSINVLNKLIDTFKNINIEFSKRDLKNSKCIILIRSDIIQELNKRSSNLNKILLDNSVELYWIEKENTYPERQMLMEMVLNKIKTTCSEYSNISNAELYRKLFPELINGIPIINYMINYSFGRPRDIITFLEIVKKRYPNETHFKRYMFKECRQSYSKSFFYELQNEMKVHLSSETAEDYLNLIRNFGKNSFYFSELKKYYRNHRKCYKNIKNLNECMECLYRFGVVGNIRKINNNNICSWGYRKDGNPNINLDLKIVVHNGLRKSLNTN